MRYSVSGARSTPDGNKIFSKLTLALNIANAL
jgi:hypothetical protein